jgi:hypothetical protein
MRRKVLPETLYLKPDSKGHVIFKRVYIACTDKPCKTTEFTVPYVRKGEELRGLRRWADNEISDRPVYQLLIQEIDRRAGEGVKQ